MKKKLLCLTMGAMLLVGGAATTASAADYYGYMLYSKYQNNYTSYHSKTTTSQYIYNRMTKLTGTSSATFWSCDNKGTSAYDSHRMISSAYTTSKSVDQYLTFKSSYKKSKGDKVAMGMEDGVYHTSSVGSVSGTVDFK